MHHALPNTHLRGLEARVRLRGGPSGPRGSSGPADAFLAAAASRRAGRLRLGSARRFAGIAGSLEQSCDLRGISLPADVFLSLPLIAQPC